MTNKKIISGTIDRQPSPNKLAPSLAESQRIATPDILNSPPRLPKAAELLSLELLIRKTIMVLGPEEYKRLVDHIVTTSHQPLLTSQS
jgi:hypothetical protein